MKDLNFTFCESYNWNGIDKLAQQSEIAQSPQHTVFLLVCFGLHVGGGNTHVPRTYVPLFVRKRRKTGNRVLFPFLGQGHRYHCRLIPHQNARQKVHFPWFYDYWSDYFEFFLNFIYIHKQFVFEGLLHWPILNRSLHLRHYSQHLCSGMLQRAQCRYLDANNPCLLRSRWASRTHYRLSLWASYTDYPGTFWIFIDDTSSHVKNTLTFVL